MSIWTGLMPHDHCGFGNWRLLRPDLRDQGLIHPFQAAGYHTIYNGKWHVPGTTPARFGFADVEAIPAVLDGQDRGRYIEDYRTYATEQGYELVPGNIENLTPSDVDQLHRPAKAPYGTSAIPIEHFLETWQTGMFLNQLERRPADSPFFAVCSFNAPHFPMIAPEPYDRLINPDELDLPSNALRDPVGKPAEVVDSSYHEPDWPESEWRNLIAHYLGLCALIDTQVGQILTWVESQGLTNNTIVAFTSDHGDMMGSHRLNKKGYPLHYDEALRVPMIVAGPNVAAGKRGAPLISLRDLVPTLADLCGVDLNVAHDGVSFAPALNANTGWHGRPYVLAESFKLDGNEGGVGEDADPAAFDLNRDGVNVSIRTPEFRYIYRLHDEDELYDEIHDPGEISNLAADSSYADRITAFRDIISASLEMRLPTVARHIREGRQTLVH
jgi:arylsulfatase A-like enzyme